MLRVHQIMVLTGQSSGCVSLNSVSPLASCLTFADFILGKGTWRRLSTFHPDWSRFFVTGSSYSQATFKQSLYQKYPSKEVSCQKPHTKGTISKLILTLSVSF